jgi:hypothetical protein
MINTKSVPEAISEWCTFGSLAGCYWVAKSNSGGHYWSNGQVREIAALLADPEVRKAAVAYLETANAMEDSADWYGHMLEFFAKTAEAGSGASTG